MYALDLEATGTDPAKDRIIQIGLVNMMGGDTVSYTIDPDRPIPQEVAALTGLDDHAVFGCPKFAKVAYHIATTIHDEVLVTFNGLRFDVPMLAEEFERAGVDYKFGPIIDVGVLFKMHHTRTLADAVRIYLGKEMEGAHDAVNDAKATAAVLEAMAKKWEKIHHLTAGEVAALCHYGHPPADPHGILVRIDGKVCYTHKRVRGVPVEDDLGYAGWMLQNDFPAATKRVLREELRRISPDLDSAGGW